MVREEIIEHILQELQSRGAKTYMMPNAIRWYVELTGVELRLKEKVIKEDSLFDGKWVLRLSTELPSEEMAQCPDLVGWALIPAQVEFVEYNVDIR